MNRRAFLSGLRGGLLAAPLAAEAQQTTRLPLIGFLCNTARLAVAFDEGLHDLGYINGRNISIERRCLEGRMERASELAADLLRLKPDVLVGATDPVVKVLAAATKTIPIVMTSGDQDSFPRLRSTNCPRESDQVRVGHQPQDRQDARPDDPAVAAAAGGSGD
jgi:ABC-type uncharacterized transport system substrate-binding protein